MSTSRNTPTASYPIVPTNYRTQSLRESTLDPQLGPYIKTEPTSRSATPNMPFHPGAYAAGSMARSYAPPMLDGPNTPYSARSQKRVPSILDSVNTPSSSDADYYVPTPRGGKRTSKRNLSISTNNSTSNYPLNKTRVHRDVGEVPWEPIPATIKDPNSKVDRVMIFDIQNAEGRKNRNQKKSVHVLDKLIGNSNSSQPDEVVYKHGIPRTTRTITGVPNSEGDRISGESSPEPQTAQPPKKIGRRTKAAMASKNVNTGVTTRRDSHQSSFSAGIAQTPYYTNSSDVNDAATYGRMPSRREAGVRIHRDNSGPAITFNGTPRMSSSHLPMQMPARMPPMSQMPVLTSGLTRLASQGQYQQLVPANLQHGNTYAAQPQAYPYGNGTMRPANMHIQRPASNSTSYAPMNYQSNNFGSFGQLNNASMTGTFGGSNPLYGRGSYGVAPGMLLQQPQYGTNGISNVRNAGMAEMSSVDPFAFGTLPLSPMGGGLDGHRMDGAANGMFFDGGVATGEDDGATISLPNSEI